MTIGKGTRAAAFAVLLAGAQALAGGFMAPRAAAQTTENAQGSLEITSGLGRKLYALSDDESIRAARAKLEADPNNATLAIALSLRIIYNQALVCNEQYGKYL